MSEEQVYTVKVNRYRAIRWYNTDNQLHRLDGPAVEYAAGGKRWYQNGKLHRLDGPAIERIDGFKAWYQNNQLHRLDGPAVEYVHGSKQWYIEGRELTESESNERTNPIPAMVESIDSQFSKENHNV